MFPRRGEIYYDVGSEDYNFFVTYTQRIQKHDTKTPKLKRTQKICPGKEKHWKNKKLARHQARTRKRGLQARLPPPRSHLAKAASENEGTQAYFIKLQIKRSPRGYKKTAKEPPAHQSQSSNLDASKGQARDNHGPFCVSLNFCFVIWA